MYTPYTISTILYYIPYDTTLRADGGEAAAGAREALVEHLVLTSNRNNSNDSNNSSNSNNTNNSTD